MDKIKLSKKIIKIAKSIIAFDCMDVFFNSYGVEIEYVEEILSKSFEAELVEEVMSLMTNFTVKLHS